MNVEQVRAKKLYADGKNAEEIAKELSKSKGTIYRWIKENKEEFEKARKLAEITLDDMTDILDEAHKEMILKILEEPATLKDPKVADALIKFVNILEKMSLRSEREKEIKKREEASERGVLIVDDIKESKKKKSE